MTPLSKRMLDLEECLKDLADAPAEAVRATSEINQSLSIDPETAEALTKNTTGNVIIVQAANIDSKILHNTNKAVQHFHKLKEHVNSDSYELENAVEILFKKGYKIEAIQRIVEECLYELALEATRTKKAAAELLGVGRTNFLDRRKQHRRNQNRRITDIIDLPVKD